MMDRTEVSERSIRDNIAQWMVGRTAEKLPWTQKRFHFLLDLLEGERAEVKRLRVQLGCVKSLATLWSESADEMERVAASADRQGLHESAGMRIRAKAESSRSHAEAIRDLFGEAS